MRRTVCKICSHKVKSKKILTRSNTLKKIYFCFKCDFEFFDFNPKKNLEDNKLEISRLKKAGLKIPSLKENFKSTIAQSKSYVKNYLKISDKKRNILEIGCAHGSFLYEAKKFGCNVTGLEINNFLRSNLNKHFGIKCLKTISQLQKEKIKFKKIFLFYSIEYFFNFKEDLISLQRMLEPMGEIIIITPNKNDIFNSIYSNKAYENFFYDINSINYFSPKSINSLMKILNFKKYKIIVKQGYSFMNFIHWCLNNRPIKTGYVGEDKFHKVILNNFKQTKKYQAVIKNMINLLKNSEISFKKNLQKNKIGNQIILKIKK